MKIPKVGDEIYIVDIKDEDFHNDYEKSLFTNDYFTVVAITCPKPENLGLLVGFVMTKERLEFLRGREWREDGHLELMGVTIGEHQSDYCDLSKVNSLCRR